MAETSLPVPRPPVSQLSSPELATQWRSLSRAATLVALLTSPGAYLVFLALILVYVAIMAIRLSHLQRDLDELLELAEQRDRDREEVGSAR